MKILLVDFWSDGNLGDALMQSELLHQCKPNQNAVSVVSCFGRNQNQLNAFHESKKFDSVFWWPGFFYTYIALDYAPKMHLTKRYYRLLKTLCALLFSRFRLELYRITRFRWFLGEFAKLLENDFSVIVLNGRNYRDFGSRLKNYINNEPLLLHQEIMRIAYPNVKKVNAGVSIWSLASREQRILRRLFAAQDLVVARESFTFEKLKSLAPHNSVLKSDLSFPILARRLSELEEEFSENYVALILTDVSDSMEYMSGMSLLAKALIARGLKVKIVQQIYLPQETTKHLEEQCDFEFELLSPRNVNDALTIYAGAKAVISTRMHASIMALSCGKPVASLAYDSGAKWQILLDEIGDYPLFNPVKLPIETCLTYIFSEEAAVHAKDFSQRINNLEHEEYINDFIHNFDA